MSEIRLLDKNTIDKIAAGEVVDRPASIVKELMENSIDAGARAISVEIQNGGRSLIRITDNGSGIKSDQVRLAFMRHSTSKIQEASDLSFIHTLGFRGEALSSIAAVSRTQLLTKTEDELTGTIIKINGGEEESFEEAGLPEGTTVIIKDLFYNTPARLKFLRSDTQEANYISDAVQRTALSRPDISFKYTNNGAVRLSTPGNGSLKDTVYAIFGRDITANLLQVDDSYGCISVKGFIGKPVIARGNRNFEIFYVNGRYIRDKILQKALEDAYTGYQMKGTFPFALLDIEIEPELVDVNVHPSKMEVRFYNNEEVYNCIYEIIRSRITERENIPRVSLEHAEKEPVEMKHVEKKHEHIPEPFELPRESSPVYYDMQSSTKHESAFHEEIPVYEQASLDSSGFLSEKARPDHRIIGEAFKTYWIVEYDQDLYIIDQHAAHEKVLYERFMKRLKEDKHYSQQILPAVIVSLSADEEEILKKHLEIFRKMGFEIEPFEGSEYALSAVPTDLYGVDSKALLLSTLAELSESPLNEEASVLTDAIASAACKAAVKGGNRLSLAEADRLIDELMGLDNPFNCPHGRPTIISMSRYELEKKFKRVI